MSYIGYTEGMATPKEHLGGTLRRARKARGLRQEDVAAELEVNVRQVGRWENGKNAPSSIMLMKLFAYFRKHADAPDLQALLSAIEEQDPPDLEARLGEIRRRIRKEPWLLNRVDRLLTMTDKEFQAALRHIDDLRGQSPDQSSP